MARIDEFLGDPQIESRHEKRVVASPRDAFRAALQLDVSDSWIVGALFRLRGLPKQAMGLQDLEQLGFVALAREEDQEIVYGLVGQPWRLSGNLQSVSAEDFSKFNDPGFAKVAWNFYVSALSDTSTLLSTKIRIRCTDPVSARRFALYWALIGPVSGLIRKVMLDSIARGPE